MSAAFIVMESPRRTTGVFASKMSNSSDEPTHRIDTYLTPAYAYAARNEGDDDELVLTDHEPDIYYSPIFSPQALVQQRKFRVLGTLSLLGLTFFVSCGGPVGSEPLVSSGGPLLGLAGMALYVLLCVFPFAWVLAELCSTFPDNGGHTVWVLTAFGPFWSLQIGYWSWVSCVLNNAIYPGLIFAMLKDAFSIDVGSSAAEYLVKVAIAVILVMPSLLSVRFVGGATFALMLVILALSFVFSVYGFADGADNWSRLLDVRSSTSVDANGHEGIDGVLLVNTLFWNFDGLFDISVIAGEVRNPGRAYPRIILGTVLLMFVTYAVPLMAAVTADRFPWLAYSEDSYPSIAEAIGGKFLHHIVLACSILSSIGLFTGSIFFQAFQLLGMAQAKLIPDVFRHRHEQLQTPQYAVALSLVATTLLLAVDFEQILGMTNAFSSVIQLFIVLAMLQLRRMMPAVARPTKVPGSMVLICIMLLPTTAVFCYILVTAVQDWVSAIVLGCLVAFGLVYGFLQRHRARQPRNHRLVTGY